MYVGYMKRVEMSVYRVYPLTLKIVKMETRAEEVSGPLVFGVKMVSGETLPSAG